MTVGSKSQICTVSAQHRRVLADIVEELGADELAVPSLCSEWDVRTVIAHVASTLLVSHRTLCLEFVRARGNMHQTNTKLALDVASHNSSAQIARILRSKANDHITRPVIGDRGILTDLLIHTGDVCIPLQRAFAPNDPLDGILEAATLGLGPQSGSKQIDSRPSQEG